MLINANDPGEVYTLLKKNLGNLNDYQITDINITTILEVCTYEPENEMLKKGNFRPVAEVLAEQHGGQIVSGVSKNLNYLVVGEDAGSKLEKAKKEHKLIFLDIYTGWCGPCLHFSKTVLKDGEVSRVLNSKFINLKYDAEVGEGIEVNKKYNKRAYPSYIYPTLLILDSDGNDITQQIGYTPNAEEYKKWLEEGISKFKK